MGLCPLRISSKQSHGRSKNLSYSIKVKVKHYWQMERIWGEGGKRKKETQQDAEQICKGTELDPIMM